jgi:raffinose/stachyose/melibiose transport system permease protein
MSTSTWISPALPMKRTLFIAFAREHTFVTIFGVSCRLLVFAVFVGYPIVYTIYLSFFEWNGMTPEKTFVGWRTTLHDRRQVFLHGAAQQFEVAGRHAGPFPSARPPDRLCSAARGSMPAPTLLRTVIFFPVTMSLISVGLMFLLILNPLFGAFDTMLQSSASASW